MQEIHGNASYRRIYWFPLTLLFKILNVCGYGYSPNHHKVNNGHHLVILFGIHTFLLCFNITHTTQNKYLNMCPQFSHQLSLDFIQVITKTSVLFSLCEESFRSFSNLATGMIFWGDGPSMDMFITLPPQNMSFKSKTAIISTIINSYGVMKITISISPLTGGVTLNKLRSVVGVLLWLAKMEHWKMAKRILDTFYYPEYLTLMVGFF